MALRWWRMTVRQERGEHRRGWCGIGWRHCQKCRIARQAGCQHFLLILVGRRSSSTSRPMRSRCLENCTGILLSRIHSGLALLAHRLSTNHESCHIHDNVKLAGLNNSNTIEGGEQNHLAEWRQLERKCHRKAIGAHVHLPQQVGWPQNFRLPYLKKTQKFCVKDGNNKHDKRVSA